MVAGAGLLWATSAAAVIETTGNFDWSMPPRLLVNEAASAATLGAPVPRYDPSARMLPRGGWTVVLDACDVTDAEITNYAWRVDGNGIGSTDACTFQHAFPAEGRYAVELEITDAAGDTAVLERNVIVQDWLIVALGDSYASGEGNPIRPADLERLEDFGELLDVVQDVYDAIEDVEDAFDDDDDDDDERARIDRRNLLDDLEEEWDEERLRAARRYLDSQAVWLETPPRWGTREPTYRAIVLGGAEPGEALRCHRSMISGQARAALALEQADPRTSVTLVHLACSGARIDEGLIGPDEGQDVATLLDPLADEAFGLDYDEIRERLENLPDLPGQIDAARAAVDGREIDAMVISIGGNDLAFTDLVSDCVAGQPCHNAAGPGPARRFENALEDAVEELCSPATWVNLLTGSSLPETSELYPASNDCTQSYARSNVPAGRAADRFDDALEALPPKWQALSAKLDQTFPSLDRRRVYLTAYPDITRDDNGNYCGWTPAFANGPNRFERLPGITDAEWAWADQTVLRTLREQQESAAALNQWQFVERTGNGNATIASGSETRGYCADNGWIVRLPESVIRQQQFVGAIHPNGAGHDLYTVAIENALREDFYRAADDGGGPPVEEGQAPRTPSPDNPDTDSAGDDDDGGSSGIDLGGTGLPVLLLLGAALLARWTGLRRRRRT